jgi:3-isopropylmalate/(R)-2-methylmalate dehydratase small subunit
VCSSDLKDGDVMDVDFEGGTILNKTSGKSYTFQKMPPFLVKLMEAGGLVEYTKKQMKAKSG